ncbi:MAG: FAD-containing monooxygenase EthA, partial [Psychrobacter alimentarius]
IRLLDYMHKHRYQVALPQAKTDHSEAHIQEDTVMGALSAGYVRRAINELPKQGDRYPWYVTNNYLSDRVMLKYRQIKDDWLHFSR